MKKKLLKTFDGFYNIIKGLGTTKDPRQATGYQQGLRINQALANYLYVYNWLAAKVVDIPIDDTTRKWRSLLISDAEKKEEVKEVMDYFEVKDKINLASKWSRVFGGSVIIAVIDNEDMATPLNIERIRPGTLRNFIVLDRWNIYPVNIDRNILSCNFGRPEFYQVSRDGQNIHHTRLTKFEGMTSTIMELEQQNYWGTSIFTKLWEPVSDSQTVSQSINNLIFESNVDVYRINGFNALVAEGRDDLVTKRLSIVHEMKSIINGIALDKEDEYDKKSNTFANLPEIDDRFMQKVAGASGIPMTRLLGISPSGMNATGESDMLNYYDNVQSLQENMLRPHINWMDSIIVASEFPGLETVDYEFKPLKQLTEIEQATVDLNNKDRDAGYLDRNVITEIDVLSQLAENGTYVTIDENRVEEAKKEFEEQEKENELNFSEEEENEESDEEEPNEMGEGTTE